MVYSEWVALTHALGGVATVWPFSDDGHMGEPAARFTIAAYTAAFNAGHLPTGEGTRPGGGGLYFYVRADAMTGSDEVIQTSPHTMTLTERVANATYGHLDNAADAAGLPSLDKIESTLKDVGKNVLIGVAVTVVVSRLLRRRR